ncbi:MAG: GAF domain-containing sensor histidine kinase [Acidimicrobiales bacterium]
MPSSSLGTIPSFTPLITAIRWATTALGLLLLSTGEASAADTIIASAMLGYSLWRTVIPSDFGRRSRGALFAIAIEAAVMVTAVVATGYWESPFIFGLIVVISAAGFTGGIALALNAAALCLIGVAAPYHLAAADPSTQVTVRWAGELILVAILAGYVRRLALQARAETSRFVGQLRQLSEVNDLLSQLRQAAQTLPMSLDLTETIDSVSTRLRELFEPDVVVILLYEDERWSVAKAAGVRLVGPMSTTDLPPVLRQTAEGPLPVRLVSLGGTPPGLGVGSRSGIYARLVAQDERLGLVAVERGSEPYEQRQVEVMETVALQMAVALDNARTFQRIGTLATEQERSRIARDLHDRLGQSLALVGFELDRLAKNAPTTSFEGQILELRENVRAVVSDLREALYDLRTDVSEDHDLAAALRQFLERVRHRTGLEVHLISTPSPRLALTVEREVWRIAQEAVLNVERHARATTLRVEWGASGNEAVLVVADDGEGMPPMAMRPDGYGLVGMHERAHAIGASLAFKSPPGQGTTVRLTVPMQHLAVQQ